MNEVLAELVLFLKEASPLVWSALVKQVYIEASAKIAWAVGFLIVSLLIFKLVQYKKAEYDKEYDDGKFLTDCEWAWGYAGVALAGVLSFDHFVSAAMWFANPEFYAIRFLLEKLGGS